MSIISLIHYNDNGFSPANEKFILYIKKDMIAKYIYGITSKNEIYPLELVLIGYQKEEDKCYYQDVIVQNVAQKSRLFLMAQGYANIVYGEDFIYKNISYDWILNVVKLDEVRKL